MQMTDIEKTAIRISINSLSVKDLAAAMKSKLGYLLQELNILEIAVTENESNKKFLATSEIARDLNVLNVMSEALTRHCPPKQGTGVFQFMPSTITNIEEHTDDLVHTQVTHPTGSLDFATASESIQLERAESIQAGIKESSPPPGYTYSRAGLQQIPLTR